ncbi:hypothetical protein DMC47_09335 [Nostoc sp. 3335mG]|nr:hypothetical protein DMC47_09335 [Nostoc sp. 3335mG]
MHWIRNLALLIAAPLILTGCLFTPGQFVSTLTINKDRSFTFTYKGEVHAIDLEGMGDGLEGMAAGDTIELDTKDHSTDEDQTGDAVKTVESPAEKAKQSAEKKAKRDAELREVATQLAKEPGYNSVQYLGDNKFSVDYSISGTLTHSFLYPFNQDAAMIFPWVAVELRGKDTIRVKAPGFAKQERSGSEMTGSGESKANGSFTLITDAEIVSQNNEDGAKTEGGKRVIQWNVTPITKEAPSAVLRLNAR